MHESLDLARRIRLTTHVQGELPGLELSEKDILEVIGNFDRSTYHPDAEMTRVSMNLRGRRVEVVFTAAEDSLMVVDVRLIEEGM